MSGTGENNMFYKKVNKNNTKEMFNFINNHFTYYTMNSWNKLESIANNVKLYNLNLGGNWCNALDELFSGECSSLVDEINYQIERWEKDHPGYSLGFNGRSSGYLVMYNKEKDGRVNMRTILPRILLQQDYENFKEDCKYYYGGVKYYKDELKEYTELIQDFDKLCDDLRDVVQAYC